MMNAAGNEVVARALGRRAREHGRFDFDEAQFVHGVADLQHNLVAQRQIAVRLGPAQIEVTIAQPRLFGRVDFVLDLKWRRLGCVQNVQVLGDELDFARRELRIRLLPLDYAPFDRNDEFRARLLGLGVRFRLRFFIEDNLKDAGAVADVEKEEIAEVAAAVDPSHDNGVAAFVLGAQLAAIMRAF